MSRFHQRMRLVLAVVAVLVLAGCTSAGSSSGRVVLEPAFLQEISGARSLEEALARLDGKCEDDPTISDPAGCQAAVREFLGVTPITLVSQAGPAGGQANQDEDVCRAGLEGGQITFTGGSCVPAFHLVDAQNKPLDPAAVPPDGQLPVGVGIARDAVPPAPSQGSGGPRQPGEPDRSGPPGGDPAFLRPVASANYPDFNKFGGAPNLGDAVSRLFNACKELEVDLAESEPPKSPLDLGECKMAALQRLALSEIEFEKVSESGELVCSARWEEGENGGEGKIIVTASNREECEKHFPDGRDDRISTVSGAAYQYDRDEALAGGIDLATAAARLFAFCDANLGGVDPARCKKEQEDLLRTARIEPTRINEGQGCNPRIDYGQSELVILINTDDCETTAFPEGKPTGPEDPVRDAAITQGTDLYEKGKPTTLSGLVSAMYAECEKRTESPRDEDVASCWDKASTLATEAPYEFVGGEGDTCRANWDSTRSHIVLTGSGAACQKAFPDKDTGRPGAVAQAGTEYQQTAVLRDVTDLASAAKALHALCDSGQRGNPATCKEQSDALLKEVQIVRTGDDCKADVSSEGGKLALVVGQDCGAAFPDNPAARAAAVQTGTEQYVPPEPANAPAPADPDQPVAPADPVSPSQQQPPANPGPADDDPPANPGPADDDPPANQGPADDDPPANPGPAADDPPANQGPADDETT
jgi:hypothetical protein